MVGLFLAMALAQAPVDAERETLPQLLEIRRVFVERLSGGETAVQMRDMIISSLQRARLFVVTENPERADAVLKGSAEDLVFTDSYQSSDRIDARATVNNPLSSSSSSSSRRNYASVGVGDSESANIHQRKHEAVADRKSVV